MTAGSACSICGNSDGNRLHEVREAMFGRGDSYCYNECAQCGALRIVNPPADLAAHYPREYYSLKSEPRLPANPAKRFLRIQRDRYALSGRGLLGGFVYRRLPTDALRALRTAHVSTGTRILEVGCGTGGLLCALAHLGFRHLEGCDPYIKADCSLADGRVHVRKCGLDGLGEDGRRYELVMMHHAFEHMDDPLDVLRRCFTLLEPGGLCLIRTPVAGTYAWREYRGHWFQLDAPRHLFVHSVASLRMLAEKAGFAVEAVVFDSSEAQFIFSEQNRRGIAITSQRSWRVSPSNSVFSRAEIRMFRKRAAELNARGDGDQAAFYLRKP